MAAGNSNFLSQLTSADPATFYIVKLDCKALVLLKLMLLNLKYAGIICAINNAG